jgi:ketosteroid isomerase-like protein
MSQQDVEIVQAMFEAWNAKDMDAVRDFYDADVIARPAEHWPEPGPFVGREAVMRSYEQLREAWDADTVEPISDFIDVADRVVVRTIWRGIGHGPESAMEITHVFTVRNGRIFYQESFWEHAQALETVGLSEKDAQAGPS